MMQNDSLVTMQKERLAFALVVRGYHVYQDVWKPSIREKLAAKCEFDNPMDKQAVKVVLGNETVDHLPHEFSRIAWYFLASKYSYMRQSHPDYRSLLINPYASRIIIQYSTRNKIIVHLAIYTMAYRFRLWIIF